MPDELFVEQVIVAWVATSSRQADRHPKSP